MRIPFACCLALAVAVQTSAHAADKNAVRRTAAQVPEEGVPAEPAVTEIAAEPGDAVPGAALAAPALAPSRPLVDFGGGPADPYRFWVWGGYMRAWLNQPANSVPLLTTGPPDAQVVGVLGQPGTTVLSSTDDLRRTLNGFQTQIGWVCGDAQQWLFAVDAFYLHQPTYILYTNTSAANGAPVIARPVISAVSGAEQSYLVSEPNVLAGSSVIEARTELFGLEANAGVNRPLTPNLLGTVLFGYRGLHMGEGLSIRDKVAPLGPNILTFNASPVNPPGFILEQSSFQTNNEFNGLQLGGKLHWQYDWFFLETIGKLAVGWTDQRVDIGGGTLLFTPGGSQFSPAEVLTSITNAGRERRQVMTVVPEIGVNIGADVMRYLRVKAGYSLLAWSNVARAADQIDRTITPGRVPTDPDFGNVAAPPRPARSLDDHVLLLQSVNFGLEIHY